MSSSNQLLNIEEGGIYNPELLLVSWTSASFLLMTVSLLFYHLTIKRTLEMNQYTAGIFAVLMIFMSVAFAVQAFGSYLTRTKRWHNKKDNRSELREEGRISRSYLVIGAILIVIEIGIAVTILRGSFFGTKR